MRRLIIAVACTAAVLAAIGRAEAVLFAVGGTASGCSNSLNFSAGCNSANLILLELI